MYGLGKRGYLDNVIVQLLGVGGRGERERSLTSESPPEHHLHKSWAVSDLFTALFPMPRIAAGTESVTSIHWMNEVQVNCTQVRREAEMQRGRLVKARDNSFGSYLELSVLIIIRQT